MSAVGPDPVPEREQGYRVWATQLACICA
jgi:hypothetical protein